MAVLKTPIHFTKKVRQTPKILEIKGSLSLWALLLFILPGEE
jgi:hypothetical protein